MVTYFIIILVTLVILTLLLSGEFQRYILKTTEEELIREANELNRHYQLYDIGWVSKEYLELISDGITYYENTSIWVVRVVGDLGLIEFEYNSNNSESTGDIRPFSREEIITVLKGNITRNTGYFGERFSVPVLTIGVPLKLNGYIRGAIFLHTPLEDIERTLFEIYKSIWRAALFSCGLSILFLYWTSLRISRPLSQMSEVSMRIAKGDYSQRVKVNSLDETGQLAVSFNAMADSLEKLEQMRRTFVANVSHELRSPLTSMRGYIQGILDKTIDSEDQEKYLKIALEETQRLSKLIDDLLNLSRMESEQFKLNFSIFDINEQIRRLLIAREESIESKGLQVEVDFEKEQCMVEADKDRIQQVIINLLDNAIKFNKEGGILLFKTWRHKDKVYIKIQDQGIGIPKEEIPHIWERFYQVDKSRSGQGRGTGLGLSIVKRILDEHNQNIWVNSKVGEGTAFIFSLKSASKKIKNDNS